MLAGHANITTRQRYMNACAFARGIDAPGTSPTQCTRRSRRTERSGGVMMQSVKIGFEALPIVPILSRYLFRADQDPRKMARPARIELAAPRLGGGCSIP